MLDWILTDAPCRVKARLIIKGSRARGDALETAQKVDVTIRGKDAPTTLNASPPTALSLPFALQTICSVGIAFLWSDQEILARISVWYGLAFAPATILGFVLELVVV